MADEIGVGVSSSGAEGIEKLIASLNKLDISLDKLATHGSGATNELALAMESMQRTMMTGFAEMAALSARVDQKIVRDRQSAQAKLEADQRAFEDRQHASANKYHAKVETDAQRSAEKIAAQDQANFDKRRAMEQNQQVQLATIRAKEVTDAEKISAKILADDQANADKRRAQEQKQQIDLATIRATAREKERTLDTAYQTATLTSRIRMAEQAQAYAGLGGDATSKYGASAAAANIAALRAEHNALQNAVNGSTNSIHAHNAAMNEAHSLARGLSGSLGALWLTYGSIVPLLAGAAIAASLKNIVEVGKDVEYQLKFVEALSKTPVDLNKFLSITDATVVSVHEAAEGMRALAQNGLSATESLRALPDVLNLAVIGEMGVAQAALSATGAVSAFGLQIQDISRVGDIFAQTAASSNTSVLAMTESMRQASTVASIYQVSIEETAAALGTLAKVNIIGSAAGTAYTNMLTNLYTPTKQASKALQELKVTTDDGNGGLKNSSQLLTEMQIALSRVNETARASYLGDIFTTRGQKAASTLLENLDDYKKKIDDAKNSTGFMADAVAKLEDSTTGAAKHLQNAFGASLTQAFASSSGALQEILMHMAQLARSKETVSTLTAIADAALRVTNLLIDHAAAIGYVVAGYAAMRVLAAVPATLKAIGEAVAALTFSLRTLASLTGVFGLALAALTIAYELFIDKTTDVEKADTRMRNSIQTNIDFLERETKALEERNKARNPAAEAAKVPVSAQAVSSLQTQIANAPSFMSNVLSEGIVSAIAGLNKVDKLQTNLAEAQRQQWKETALAENLAVEQSIERFEKEKTSTLEAIDRLVRKGQTEKTIAGELIQVEAQGNEKSRAMALSAAQISKDLLANKISTKQASIELLAVEQKYNALLEARAPALNSDAYRAAQTKLRGEIEATKDAAKSAQADIEEAYKSGEISSINRYARQRDVRIAAAEMDKVIFAREEALAAATDKRQTDQQKISNNIAAKDREIKEAGLVYDRHVLDDITKSEQQTTAYRVTELQKQGKTSEAYQLANADRAKRLDQQIATSSDDLVNALAENDGQKIASALKALQVFRLEQTQIKATITEIGRIEGVKKAEKEFDNLFSTMVTGIDEIQQRSGPGTGLGGLFQNALAAQKLYADSIDAIVIKQKQLVDLDKTPEEKTAALERLKKLNDEAAQMRTRFLDLGKTIGQSLTEAFGKGGKALGSMLDISLTYAAKQKQIDADLAKSSPANREQAELDAIKSTESAKLDAMGNMASAAAGFFDSQSKGYRALMTISQVVHAAELAMNLASIAPAMAAGAAQFFAQSGWGGFAGVAAMAAVVAGFGVAVSGTNHSGPTVADQQAQLGTGSVLGDTKAKSESVSRSLDMLTKNSERNLFINNSMLTALQGIQSGIAGLGGLVARQMGVSSPFSGVKTGTSGISAGGTVGLALLGGLLPAFIANIFKTTTSIADQGFSISKQTVGAASQGVAGSQYADVRHESLFNNYVQRQTAGLDAAMSIQFGQIIKSLRDGVLAAVEALHLGSESITDALNNFVVDIPEISTKGLTGAEIEKQLEAAFSKLGDDMASSVDLGFGAPMASLQSVLQMFQQVGEGTFETLTRLAGNYQVVDAVLKASGQAIDQVGLVSVVTHQRLVDMAGGLDKFTERGQYFAQNFLTAGEQLDLLREAVGTQLNLAATNTTEQFKKLVQGLNLADATQMETYTNLMKLAPAFKELADAQEAALKERRSLEIEILDAQGKSVESLAARRAEELAALQKTNPELVALKKSLYDIQDATAAADKALARRNLEISIMEAQGHALEAVAARRADELAALQKTNPELVGLTQQLYAAQDAAKAANIQRGLDIALMEALGGATQALAMKRHDELAALDETHRATQQAIYDAQDRASAVKHAFDVLKTSIDLGKTKAKVVYEGQIADIEASQKTAKAAYDAQVVTAKAQRTSAEKIYNDLKDSLDATLTTAKNANQALDQLASSLSSTLSTMLGNTDPAQQRKQAQAQISNALAVARSTGVLPNADALKDALSTVSRPSEDLYTTFVEYRRDQALTAGDITDLNTLTGQQKSVSDLQLLALQAQLDQAKLSYDAQVARYEKEDVDAKTAYDKQEADFQAQKDQAKSAMDAEIERLDAVLAEAQRQTDVMNGTYTATLSIEQALKEFNAAALVAIQAQQAAQVAPGLTPPAAVDQVESLYRSILGRTSDAVGKAFWDAQFKGGETLASIANSMYKSVEYGLTQGHPTGTIGAFAGGGYASGWAMVGELGPEMVNFSQPGRVYTAEQTNNMFGGGNDMALREEIRLLREQNARMATMLEAHLYAIAKTNQSMYDIEDNWDNAGMPAVRVDA